MAPLPLEAAGASPESPFHAGERALQSHAGLRDKIEQIGRVIVRDHMPDQHRELFEKLPFVLIGSLDEAGQPWASILVGRPGFVHTPDARRLRLRARPAAADPLAANLAVDAPVGLLGIELPTRRRNRANGLVRAIDAEGFEIEVRQSFGNCPKYIQARSPSAIAPPESLAEPHPVWHEAGPLSARARALIGAADTFFIASASGQPHAAGAPPGRAEGVDVSHRGGKPGFVRVHDEAGGAGERVSVLTVPDFTGNFLFNTLGNLLVRPAAGLLFVDFDGGDLLWLAGRAEVVLDGPELASFAGAERLLRVYVTGGRGASGALPLRFGPPQMAAQLAATGAWDSAPAATGAWGGAPAANEG
jgi:uncharacterized protein